MNKFIILIFLLIVNNVSYGQIAELKLIPKTITTDINGGTIEKGDTIQVSLEFKNNNSQLKNFYLDFQHQITAINMIDVVFPTPGGQNSALPNGTSTSYTNNYYSDYSWVPNPNNTTEYGLQNAQYSIYNHIKGSGRAINRITINTATPGGNSVQLRDGILCTIRFKVEQVSAGFAYDPIYYNFAYGWDNMGFQKTIIMPKPNSATVNISPTSNALINGSLQTNVNLTGSLRPRIIVVDSLTSVVKANIQVSTNGSFVLSNELSPNTTYYASATIPSDSLSVILNKSVTVSDYTAAQSEFIRQNLNGTFSNTVMKSGMSFFAADINFNKSFDGGDVGLLFSQSVGSDVVIQPLQGQSLYNLPLFTSDFFNTSSPEQSSSLFEYQKVKFRTSNVATNLNLKYLIPGDINRSHSSQVQSSNGDVIINSINTKSLRITSSLTNTPNNIPSINVTLNNLTVVSNTIEIPININTNGNLLSALQFEFVYDKSKIKFEELKSEISNKWVIFVNKKDAIIRVVSIDKELKYPVSGILTPFKLKFSSVENGLDLSTKIKVTSNMDASDNNGTQLGINLNTTTIKLTGYNFFK